MLNKAILMGRLTRDPELKRTQNDTAVASFTLALDRDRKGANGERQTDFIDCVAWGKQAEFVKQWFTKGMMAVVVGRIQSRTWEDKNGNKRKSIEVYVAEMNFGETKKARQTASQPADDGYMDALASDTDFTDLGSDDESDIPF